MYKCIKCIENVYSKNGLQKSLKKSCKKCLKNDTILQIYMLHLITIIIFK